MMTGVLSLLMLGLMGTVVADDGNHPHDEEAVLNFHGSGTTNPSKCYWYILDKFEDRSKHPIRGTYRAVGSTTGIAELINGYDPEKPASDFGSGDLPLNKTVYDRFVAENIEVLHLPVFLGAVSFFHSVPVTRLNLTGCLLARIFKRDITEWNHEEIVELNPELDELESLPSITVARRVRGSSSTAAMTNYLLEACPEHWTADMAGPLISWPSETLACEGSGGVTACINDRPGTIGYIDAGHGISAGLSEIELENKDGTLLTSQKAAANGGIDAAEAGEIPPNATDDFSQVNLLNRPGEFTWPLVLMTYVYVRKNLTFLAFPDEQTLLIAFLKSLYDENFVEQCVKEYGFTLPSESTRQLALSGIDSLITHPDAHPFSFETSTLPIEGAGYYVISAKRQGISDVERKSISKDVASLQAANIEMKQLVDSQQQGMTDTQETQLKAALVLSSLSFVMCVLMGCFLVTRTVATKAAS